MLAIINVELELLSLKIKHPESFVSPISPTYESDLYVIPKSKDLGIIGIAEIVIGLSFLGEVVGKDGKPVPLVRLAHGFEVLFNLTYIIHSGFISGYQNRYGDNLKPPTNVYHRMTA